jgi:hypothetical protein
VRRVLVVTLGLLAAGCGYQVSGSATSPAVADASRVDMCTILTDAELTGLGIEVNTRKQVDRLGLIGCGWQGTSLTLGLERDNETLASYKARRHSPTFTSFADNTVNGRTGAHLSVDRDRTDCTQLMDGGSVSLTVSVAPTFSFNGPPVDSCAEALRIAQMIEPRLPKAGS